MQNENAGRSRTIKCPQCERKFKSKRALKQHQQALHEKAFKCKFCNKTFKTGGSLAQHITDKHRKTFECLHCPRKFFSNEELIQHAKEMHQPERVRVNPPAKSDIIIRNPSKDAIDEVSGFKCPRCGSEKAIYNQASAPLYSKRSHLFIVCSICGKGFRDTDY